MNRKLRMSLIAALIAMGSMLTFALPAQAYWYGYEWFPKRAVPNEPAGSDITGWIDYTGYNSGGRAVTGAGLKNWGNETEWLCIWDTLNGGAGRCIVNVGPSDRYLAYGLDNYPLASADAYVYISACDAATGQCGPRAQVHLMP